MAETNPTRILVIEDESDIAALIAYQLAHAGYQVRTATTGKEALRALEAELPDLIVLDIMLPEISGADLLRTLRSRKETQSIPVVVLTALREEADRVCGFELGADDYISKPFSPKELVLRVRAVLRRSRPDEKLGRPGRTLRAGPLAIDVDAHRVAIDGEEVKITATEFRLLVCLFERRGRTQSRSALLEAVWDTAADFETRTVDMHMGRLRSKLGPAGNLIETVRGFGYRFRAED